jgi:hypothetical protein
VPHDTTGFLVQSNPNLVMVFPRNAGFSHCLARSASRSGPQGPHQHAISIWPSERDRAAFALRFLALVQWRIRVPSIEPGRGAGCVQRNSTIARFVQNRRRLVSSLQAAIFRPVLIRILYWGSGLFATDAPGSVQSAGRYLAWRGCADAKRLPGVLMLLLGSIILQYRAINGP